MPLVYLMHLCNGAKYMSSLLSEIATVKGGYPFRGKIPEIEGGDSYAVQIKNINEFDEIQWNTLISTNLSGRKPPDWLVKGDVLFAARGQRNVATYVDQVKDRTVCGPHFFRIQIKQNANILPEFLAWQLNQAPAQKYITQSAEGSLQLSIRRGALEATPIVIPCLKEQQTVIELYKKAKQEKKVLTALIRNTAQQMQGIAQKVLASNQQKQYSEL